MAATSALSRALNTWEPMLDKTDDVAGLQELHDRSNCDESEGEVWVADVCIRRVMTVLKQFGPTLR